MIKTTYHGKTYDPIYSENDLYFNIVKESPTRWTFIYEDGAARDMDMTDGSFTVYKQ